MGTKIDKQMDSIGIHKQAKVNGQVDYGRIVMGQYNSTEPTLTDGQRAYLLLNEKGHLKVDTELDLHTDNVTINNIKNYSTDGTSANVVYGKADSDGTVNINTTKIKGTATDVNSGNKSDGSQRVVIATDDIPIALINTNLGDIETDIEASNTLLGTIAGDTTSIDTNLTDVIDPSAHIVRVVEQDPVIYHFTPEVIASVTNATDGTYPYYIDMDTFKKVGFQISADGGSGTVTVTIEATMQDDGTAPASCTYEDVTLSLFNAASFVTTTADIYSLIDNSEVLSLYKYVKIKVVADTTGANDADWTIRSKKVY